MVIPTISGAEATGGTTNWAEQATSWIVIDPAGSIRRPADFRDREGTIAIDLGEERTERLEDPVPLGEVVVERGWQDDTTGLSHGAGKARYRGLRKVLLQQRLTAAVVNLKRLLGPLDAIISA